MAAVLPVLAGSRLDHCAALAAIAVHHTAWNQAAESISTSAAWAAPAGIVLAVLAVGLLRHRPALVQLALQATFVLLASGLLAQGLKAVSGRPRPYFKGYSPAVPTSIPTRGRTSFPSGHTVAAFALAATLSGGAGRWRWPLYGWAFLVGLSRLVVGAHWVSDVLAGVFLGLALGVAVRRVHFRLRRPLRLTVR